MTEPVRVEVTLDIDRYLARFRGTDQEGEPVETPTTLEDIIIVEAARQIVTRAIAKTTQNEFLDLRRRVRDIRDETIRARIAPLIEESLVIALQPTNSYGEPTGEPATLRQIIVDTATRWLKEPDGDQYRNPKRLSPVRKLIEEEVDKALMKELKTAVADAKAEVVAAVKEQGAKVLAETIVAMAGQR